MKPIVYFLPSVTVARKPDGTIRGSCRACGTVAVIADEVCVSGFKKRHQDCTEGKS